MKYNTAIGCGIGLSMVFCAGALPSVARPVQGLTHSKHPSLPALHLLAQLPDDDSSNLAGTVLRFNTESSNAPVTQLQVLLKQAVVASPVDNTVLPSSVLGPVTVKSALGDLKPIDGYKWTVDPASKLYLGRSGYKSLVARYRYGNGGQSAQYALDIACQSVGLKTQHKANCKVFGNGPLLKGEFRLPGQLVLEDAAPTTTTTPASGSAAQAAYRRGYELGQLDAQQKLSRNYARHKTEFEGATETEFRRGYDNAYGNFSSPSS
ncbi:MAG TPA: hypothetical protein V6D19_06490 [Stenomitos sp.]